MGKIIRVVTFPSAACGLGHFLPRLQYCSGCQFGMSVFLFLFTNVCFEQGDECFGSHAAPAPRRHQCPRLWVRRRGLQRFHLLPVFRRRVPSFPPFRLPANLIFRPTRLGRENIWWWWWWGESTCPFSKFLCQRTACASSDAESIQGNPGNGANERWHQFWSCHHGGN